MRIRTVVAAVAVPLTLLAAACGDDGDDTASSGSGSGSGEDRAEQTTTAPATGDHNEADAAFAQMMIPHHRQAVEMAALVPGRGESPTIGDLAERIEGAQDPEIEQMTAWLEEWGEEVPAEAAGAAGHATGGGGHTDGDPAAGHGMMSAEDMSALEAASGAAFDRMFAEMMIEHHEGAVRMANDEIADGQHRGAIDLAHAIVDAQEAEIAEMERFLGQTPVTG